MITYYVVKVMEGRRFMASSVYARTCKHLVDAEKFGTRFDAEKFIKKFGINGEIIEVNGWGVSDIERA